ncbi:hypothetical protein Tco_0093460 [Tanacetum coccineum]
MPILHSFEENKLEYEDEDEVKIKIMGTKIDKESLEPNIYKNDIALSICHNFPLTSNPTIKPKDLGSFRMKKSLTTTASIAGIWLRAASPSTNHPSEIPSPPLSLPSTSHKYDTPEADMPLRKRAHFPTPASRFEVEESSTAVVGYGIRDVWDDMVRDMEERAPTTVKGLSQRVTDLSTTLAQDTHEIYVRLEDAQDDRALQRARVNTLFRDRRYHLHTVVLVQIHETHIQTLDARIGSLKTLVATLVAQTLSLQTQLTIALGRIQILEAREPAHTDDPEDTGSSC